MEADSRHQLLQVIKYPTFSIEICDKVLSDVDISNVDEKYRPYIALPHIPLRLEKLFLFVFKTLPSTETLQGIYSHVSIVSKYCMCVFSTATISHKSDNKETNSAFSEEQLLLLISNQDTVLNEWEESIEDLLLNYDCYEEIALMEKIRWTIKLTKLTVLEYL